MINKINTQGGFVSVLVLAIVAAIAIGGGVYVVKKTQENNQEKINIQAEDNLEIKANDNTDVNTNINAKADIGVDIGLSGKSKLNSLLSIGKDTLCVVESTKGGVTSSGNVYISSNGEMRGDFKTMASTSGNVDSHMIVNSESTYVWSGSQGSKMSNMMISSNTNSDTKAESKNEVSLDSEVNYKCEDWSKDSSKFAVPSGVNFMDIDALIKGSAGIKIPGVN